MNNCEKEKYKDIFETAKKIYECPDITDDEKIARIILVGTMLLDNTNPKVMLPKPKESEDERIRKSLIKYINYHGNAGDFTKQEFIAWVEKQGEMKSDINDDILLRFAFYQYDDDTLYLSSVFVEECNRKHGYGTKILKAAEEVAKTFGISKIRLKVETNSWMEKWYKRNGYEYLTSEGKYDWLEKQVERKQNITNLISDLGNYFATTTKEQQKKDWDEIKNWEEKHFNHDRHIEQKPTDKVEPKFKVGDWIINSKGMLQHIVDVDKTGYQTDNGWLTHDYYEKGFHLWTIQDAKDGDVLYSERGGGVESLHLVSGWKKVDGENTLCSVYTYRIEDDEIITGGLGAIWWHGVQDHFFPATKEQRDLLFSKMKEAGYKWDADKKELKKSDAFWERCERCEFFDRYDMCLHKENFGAVTDKSKSNCENKNLFIQRVIKQKSTAWSEEVEKNFNTILNLIRDSGMSAQSANKLSSWFKSLRQQMKG